MHRGKLRPRSAGANFVGWPGSILFADTLKPRLKGNTIFFFFGKFKNSHLTVALICLKLYRPFRESFNSLGVLLCTVAIAT